jgi:hypothetical protein
MPVRTILFHAANPISTNQLRLDHESKKIRDAIDRSRHRDDLRLETRGATTAEDLRRALTELRPSVVHFSGHGCNTGEIILENDAGNPHKVLPEALSDLFGLCQEHVECVVLNCCYSNDQALAIAEHIPFVIGMTDEIGDSAAIVFSGAFYDGLGAGEDYRTAYMKAKTAVNLAGLAGYHDSAFNIQRKPRITEPRARGTVGQHWVRVKGVTNPDVVGQLYLLTGGLNRLYLFGKITPDSEGNWEGEVNVGDHTATATITLIAADQVLADYIEFYKAKRSNLEDCGFSLSRIPGYLHSVKVNVVKSG